MSNLSENTEDVRVVLDIFETVLVVCGLVAGASIAIANLLHGFFPERFSFVFLNVVFVICAVIMVISIVFLFKYSRKKRRINAILFAEYYNLLHDYRNWMNSIERDIKARAVGEHELASSMKTFLKDALDRLTYIFHCDDEKHPVNACVKLVDFTEAYKVMYNETKVSTLVRSKNSPTDRDVWDKNHLDDPASIKDNTDFREIASGEIDMFYQKNLLKYKKDLEKSGKTYDNTTPNWQKHYVATAVVPIRIAYANITTEKKSGYCILGFLCVDSLCTNVFLLSRKKKYRYILKSFASLLFNVLYKYRVYTATIESESQQTVRNTQDVVKG